MKPSKKEIQDRMLKDLNDFMKDFDIEEISFGKTHKIKRTQDEKAEDIVYKKPKNT